MELIEFIAKAGETSQSPGIMGALFPILLMLPIFYFLLIRPQKKQREKHQKMLLSLSKGDQIVTSSGIVGTIYEIDEKIITLTVADKTKIKIMKNYIATKYQEK